MDSNEIRISDNLVGRRQPLLLSPEEQDQHVRSIIALKSDIPPHTNSTINEMLNGNGTAGVGGAEFLSRVRTSILTCSGGRDDNNDIISDEQRGLTTTIADTKEWSKEEKQYETALRLFPDILSEQFNGLYLIQWLIMQEADGTYNLKNISLIPLVTKLGSELQQFDDGLRGGLLSPYPSGLIPLDHIICYDTEGNNELRDECFSTVRNWIRKNNLLVNEDIQRYNLVRELVANSSGFVSEPRLQYLINMDPVSLSLPCWPQQGNWFPIHYSVPHQGDIQLFSLLLKAGLQYFPDKFGFLFCDGTHRNNNGTLIRGTPFEIACDKYGQAAVMKVIMDRMEEYCSSVTTSTSDAANNRAISFLMAAITDDLIHRDALYILLRKEPTAALLRLHQQSLRDALCILVRNYPADALLKLEEQLQEQSLRDTLYIQQQVLRVEEDRQTGTNTPSNDNNSNGDATDTIAAATVSAFMTTTTTTVPSTTTTATAAPRDSVTIIPFQASMDPY